MRFVHPFPVIMPLSRVCWPVYQSFYRFIFHSPACHSYLVASWSGSFDALCRALVLDVASTHRQHYGATINRCLTFSLNVTRGIPPSALPLLAERRCRHMVATSARQGSI